MIKEPTLDSQFIEEAANELLDLVGGQIALEG